MPIPYRQTASFSLSGLPVAEAASTTSLVSSLQRQQRSLAFASSKAAPPRRSSSSSSSSSSPEPQHLILVGGGHAHVQVLKALNAQARPAHLRVTLIDMCTSASYSGMVPGCVSGLYTPEQTLIHLEPLVAWAGIDFVKDRVVDIDFENKLLYVQNQPDAPLHFDAISLDIGSTSRDLNAIPGAREYTIATRPIDKLIGLVEEVRQEWEEKSAASHALKTTATRSTGSRSSNTPELVVIGGGAAGIELSLAVTSRWTKFAPNLSCTLLDGGDALLPSESLSSRTKLGEILESKNIKVRHGCQVQEVTPSHVVLATGEEIPFTNCIWATGAGAHSLAQHLQLKRGLEASEHGWITVEPTLQSTSYPFVFAAGDCASVQHMGKQGPPPKAGVYAVRAGPILIKNLTRYLEGLVQTPTTVPPDDLVKYEMQDDFLKLLVTGDGRALGFRFGLPLYGKWVFELKDHIDKTFMQLFQVDGLPDRSKITRGEYDTSEYDAATANSTPPDPREAAVLLQRTDDHVDYQEAWRVLRAMAQDAEYRQAVLEEVENTQVLVA
jgi:selenide,water dikinase